MRISCSCLIGWADWEQSAVDSGQWLAPSAARALYSPIKPNQTSCGGVGVGADSGQWLEAEEAGGIQRGQTQSNPVKPSQTGFKP
jgi:hypothetical protein